MDGRDKPGHDVLGVRCNRYKLLERETSEPIQPLPFDVGDGVMGGKDQTQSTA